MNWHASFSADRKIKICLPGREHAILFLIIWEMKKRNLTFIQSIESWNNTFCYQAFIQHECSAMK